MADQKISSRPAAIALLGSEYVPYILIAAEGRATTQMIANLANVVNTANDFASDAAAAAGGVAVGKLYHTAGVVKIRLT